MIHTLEPGHPSAPRAEVFERTLDVLAEHFDMKPVGELPDAVAGPRPLAALTFDDGFLDHRQVILPALLRRGIRATFFVCPDFAEGKCDIARDFQYYRGLKPMDVQDVRHLAAAGMEIGAHTLTHPRLSALSIQDQEREILGSQQRLQDWTGQPVQSFAIPFGGADSFTAETLAIIRNHFRVCCTTLVGTTPVVDVQTTDCAVLRRLELTPFDSQGDVEAKLRGDWDVFSCYMGNPLK